MENLIMKMLCSCKLCDFQNRFTPTCILLQKFHHIVWVTWLLCGFDHIKQYRQARARVGLVPQEISTDMFETVWNTVSFSRGLFGKPADPAWIEKVLKDLSLWDKKDSKIIRLSGGMKRRVMIAKALSHEPRVLFLDEPTAGVDVSLRRDMWQLVKALKQTGVTIILTTHYLEEAETLCSRVALLKQGEVIALDSTKNLLASMPGKKLRLKLSAALPATLKDIVRNQEQQDYTLSLNAIHQVEYVLAELRNANVTVEDMQLIEPDLEDVFVDLMGRT
jgi:ABC-2 type transport system ATP-binding protein